MKAYTLAHLSDAVLLRDVAALVARDRLTTAEFLAYIAEVDARRLYAPAGYPSMFAYCVNELRLSEDATYKRIQAARAARQFPALFTAVAEGRLHLTAVGLIAPHLTLENLDELIAAATHKGRIDIEAWLARRFQKPEAPPRAVVRAISAQLLAPEQVHGEVSGSAPHSVGVSSPQPSMGVTSQPMLAPELYLVHVAVTKSTHDKLRYAQALLSHSIPKGDVAQLLDRALEVLIDRAEKARFGAARKTRTTSRLRHPGTARVRHVPAHVRRAVWERDLGQCTFVSASGKRCASRAFLQFDHIDPVARGGLAIVDGMRLRCRAHNQFEAERAFGAGFMAQKRDEARARAAEEKARAVAQERGSATSSPGCAPLDAAPTRRAVPPSPPNSFRAPRSKSGSVQRSSSSETDRHVAGHPGTDRAAQPQASPCQLAELPLRCNDPGKRPSRSPPQGRARRELPASGTLLRWASSIGFERV